MFVSIFRWIYCCNIDGKRFRQVTLLIAENDLESFAIFKTLVMQHYQNLRSQFITLGIQLKQIDNKNVLILNSSTYHQKVL